jgi:hypothetical protein
LQVVKRTSTIGKVGNKGDFEDCKLKTIRNDDTLIAHAIKTCLKCSTSQKQTMHKTAKWAHNVLKNP